jgi:hypothetical protein
MTRRFYELRSACESLLLSFLSFAITKALLLRELSIYTAMERRIQNIHFRPGSL